MCRQGSHRQLGPVYSRWWPVLSYCSTSAMCVRESTRIAFRCSMVLLFLAAAGRAQNTDPLTASTEPLAQSTAQSSNPFRGFTGYEYFSFTSDPFGQLYRLDTNAGYNFNQYFGFDIGIPLYLANGSPTMAPPGSRMMPSGSGGTSLNNASGPGDVYADLLLTVPVPGLNWYSTLTGTLPTGKVAAGFSTGRPTFNWDNYFEHDFSHWHPFGDAGIANSIYDTGSFVLPYTTYGLVTHLEGGMSYQIFHPISIGASVYDDIPFGRQTVFSRVLPHAAQNGPCVAASAFECGNETVGPAAIARDHGISAWIQSSSFRGVFLFGGYSYSTQYQFNTFSLGVGVRLGPLFRKAQSAFDKSEHQP